MIKSTKMKIGCESSNPIVHGKKKKNKNKIKKKFTKNHEKNFVHWIFCRAILWIFRFFVAWLFSHNSLLILSCKKLFNVVCCWNLKFCENSDYAFRFIFPTDSRLRTRHTEILSGRSHYSHSEIIGGSTTFIPFTLLLY